MPNTDALFERLKKVAVLKPQPEVHIRGDGSARYESRRPGGLRLPARRHRRRSASSPSRRRARLTSDDSGGLAWQ